VHPETKIIYSYVYFHEGITEPVLLKIQSISDDRGLLVPFTDDIDPELFQRSYVIENYGHGVIRGLHYHKEEIKIFYCCIWGS